jgi:hypothetical protein
MNKMTKYSALFLALGIALTFGFSAPIVNSNTIDYYKVNNATRASTKSVDQKVLLGNWVRTDADYNIKILEVNKDGKLKAGYFNPKSINVAKATWKKLNGELLLYIELRDVNYPGSNYNLTYYPEKDMLTGKYFQAVTGETYEILFTRVK